MADALDMLENIKALDIKAIVNEALSENLELMADLNASQLAQGIRVDGSEILPSYRPLTIKIKTEEKTGLAAITDRVTLFDHGDHYKQLYAAIKGDEIEHGSRDEKSAKLQKKYGTKEGPLYGNTDDNKEELMNGPVGNAWKKKVEAATGLTLK